MAPPGTELMITEWHCAPPAGEARVIAWSAEAIVAGKPAGRIKGIVRIVAAKPSRQGYVCVTVLQIKLADRKACAPDDPMGRDWIGYDRTVRPESSLPVTAASGSLDDVPSSRLT